MKGGLREFFLGSVLHSLFKLILDWIFNLRNVKRIFFISDYCARIYYILLNRKVVMLKILNKE